MAQRTRSRRQLITTPDAPLQTPDDRGYVKAKRAGRLTFTLSSADRCAPETIRDWAKRAARAGAPALKVGTALLEAAAFDRDQADHGSKIPD